MQTKHEQKADYTFSPLCKWNAIGAHKCNLIQILRVIVILLKNLWRCLILIIMKTTAKYSINASDQEENYRLKLVLQVLQKHMVKKIQQISFSHPLFFDIPYNWPNNQLCYFTVKVICGVTADAWNLMTMLMSQTIIQRFVTSMHNFSFPAKWKRR